MNEIKMKINKDTFEHALNNLNFHEVVGILDSYSFVVKEKKSKNELIQELLNRIDELDEDIYLAVKSKAFSVNFDFYDGFFYKYNHENMKLSKEIFYSSVKEILDSYTHNIRFEICGESYDDENKLIRFTINRYNRKAVYDPEEDRSRFYNQQIQAKVEILIDIGLVYIHSKNATDATAIKAFLQKVLKKNIIDEKLSIKLQCPKFNNAVVENWLKENELSSKGISVLTLNMLDLLHSFNKPDAEFRGFEMKRIYFEHEVIETNEEDCKVTGMIFDGINLQKHQAILKEIIEGKKIKGFSIEVEHCYYNEDDEQKILSTIPITIMHESNQSIRISIASESLSVERSILNKAYSDIKSVFLEKVTTNQIINNKEVLEFISKIYEERENSVHNSEKDIKKLGEGARMVL